MVISKVLFGHCNCLLLCFMPRFCKTAGNNPPCSGFGRFISYKLLKILRFVAHALPPPSPWHTQHSTSIPCGVCSTPPSQKRHAPGGIRRMSASKWGSVQGLRTLGERTDFRHIRVDLCRGKLFHFIQTQRNGLAPQRLRYLLDAIQQSDRRRFWFNDQRRGAHRRNPWQDLCLLNTKQMRLGVSIARVYAQLLWVARALV